MLLASASAALGGAQPRSLLPLSDRMQIEHFGHDQHPPANTRYGSASRPSRRRLATTLSIDNTEPIRLTVDYSSLYQETAPQYSACFAIGEWFAMGLPGPEPPSNGIATCLRDGTDGDCWGRCEADDLITDVSRQQVIDIVDNVVAEVASMFRLQQSTEPLVFDDSVGRYDSALRSKGYDSQAACARDCTMLNGVAVASSYCTEGVTADAVVSITKPPVIPGVAGTGGACASDSTGRPTWLVFTWIQKIVGMTGTIEDLTAQHRGLVIHELLHALGFSNVQFRSARDASGNSKDLITMQTVDDFGADQDEVWFFKKGRAYELARTYFGCDNSSASDWNGLPLMGRPDMGRASHWETRIMRDDVMSYGGYGVVSSITLAAMEDLGFYLANYSTAQCMAWGHMQGCNFVVTRCGATISDQSAIVENQGQCEGNPNWPYGSDIDNLIATKCQGGKDPCGTLDGSGYEIISLERRCNAQCSTAQRSGCSEAPAAAVETAGEGGLAERAMSVNWEQFLFITAWILGALVFVGFMREFLCPKPGSRRVLGITNSILIAAGLACFIFNVLVLADIDTIPELDLLGEEVEAFIGRWIMFGFGAIGLILTVVGIATLAGIWLTSTKLLMTVWLAWFVAVLLQVAASIAVCYWIYVLNDMPNESLKTLQGTSTGRYDGKLGAQTLEEVEGFMCQLYRKCCRDPILDTPVIEGGSGVNEASNRTCVYAHEGTTSDVAITLEDPSSEHFCPYVTGAERRIAPPEGICNPLDHVYSLDTCRERFCTSGQEGYFDFVLNLVAFIRSYAMTFGGAFSMLVLVEVILLINLWNLRTRYLVEARKARLEGEDQMRSSDGLQIQAITMRNSQYGDDSKVQVRTSQTRGRRSTDGSKGRPSHLDGLKAV